MRKLPLFLILLLLAFPVPGHAANKVVIHKPSTQQCGVLVDSLEQELTIGNYCVNDSDCVPVDLGCPLPCHALLNTQEDIARIVALKNAYDHMCESCDNGCPAVSGHPACVDRKCVMR